MRRAIRYGVLTVFAVMLLAVAGGSRAHAAGEIPVTEIPVTFEQVFRYVTVSVADEDESLDYVVPGGYKDLEIRISSCSYTDLPAAEREEMESSGEDSMYTVLDKWYFKYELYGDGHLITRDFNGAGLSISTGAAEEDAWFELYEKYGDGNYGWMSPIKGYTYSYQVSSLNNYRVGYYKVYVAGDLDDASVTGLKDKIYTGKDIIPAGFTVKLDGVLLEQDKDYTVSYSDNKKVGYAVIELTGCGDYVGYRSARFKIKPQKAKIASLVPRKKALTVKMDKVSSQYGTTRFQVRYKVKGTKRWTMKKVSGKSKAFTLTKLKTGKRYNVQVRASGYFDGAWSTMKTSGKIK